MKYLTLIRHAKSSWDDPSHSDHDRPLNERGLRNAPIVGQFLARTYFGANGTPALLPKPGLLLSSTAARALATAELIGKDLTAGSLISKDQRLYLAEPKTLMRIVRELDDRLQHVMIFSHNPGISEFSARLLKRGGIDEMPTCAVALIELPWDSWAATDWEEGRLIGYVTPKLIEKRFLQPSGTL